MAGTTFFDIACNDRLLRCRFCPIKRWPLGERSILFLWLLTITTPLFHLPVMLPSRWPAQAAVFYWLARREDWYPRPRRHSPSPVIQADFEGSTYLAAGAAVAGALSCARALVIGGVSSLDLLVPLAFCLIPAIVGFLAASFFSVWCAGGATNALEIKLKNPF